MLNFSGKQFREPERLHMSYRLELLRLKDGNAYDANVQVHKLVLEKSNLG